MSSSKVTENKETNDRSSAVEEDTEGPTEDLRYGWWGLRPKWLQWWNNPIALCVFMFMLNTCHGATANGVLGAVQSTIEKRFQLSSTQSSWIAISYEVINIPLSLIITYVGTVGCHRTRLTSILFLFASLGFFIYALPHFTTPKYEPVGEGDDPTDNICKKKPGEDVCKDESVSGGSLSNYLYVFILGRLLMALGPACWGLMLTYLDDVSAKNKFSLYSAIFASGGIFGPAIGFIVGGILLDMWGELGVPEDEIGIEPGDPRWVGAWWLSIIVFGIGVFILTLPFTGYKKDMPCGVKVRANKISEAHNAKAGETAQDQYRVDFTNKDIIPYTKELFTNWSFLGISVFTSFDLLILGGFSVFGPKYVEVEYSKTPGEAGILFGLLVVPAAALGTIGGALIVERCQLSLRAVLIMMMAASFSVIAMGLMFLIQCDAVPFAGISIEYPDTSLYDYNINNVCNENCDCESVRFSPVCGSNDIQYFSPCHAGCTVLNDTDTKLYTNCSCILSDNVTSTLGTAANQICPNPECDFMWLFSIMLFIAMAGLFMCEALTPTALLRVVPSHLRLFALMVQSILVRLLGTIPGPIILGAVFDSSCILEEDICGESGSCYYYDPHKLAYLVMTVCITVKFGSCVCILFAWLMYKAPKMEVIREIEVEFDENDDKSKNCTSLETEQPSNGVISNGGLDNKAFVNAKNESNVHEYAKLDTNKSEASDYSRLDSEPHIHDDVLPAILGLSPSKSSLQNLQSDTSTNTSITSDLGKQRPSSVSDADVQGFFDGTNVQTDQHYVDVLPTEDYVYSYTAPEDLVIGPAKDVAKTGTEDVVNNLDMKYRDAKNDDVHTGVLASADVEVTSL